MFASIKITCDLRDVPLKDMYGVDSMRRVHFHVFDEFIGPLYISERAVFLKTGGCQQQGSGMPDLYCSP